MATKDTKAKKPATHPSYKAMVKTAITELKETKGCSRAKILNHIKANFEVSSHATKNTSQAVTSMITSGEITNLFPDKGLNGRFKITADKKPKPAKKTVVKKSAVKKAVKAKTAPKKKASPKKKTAAKKTAAKKASPKKKSVKKVTKTPTKKAVAKPKKAKKSPKKAASKKKPAKK